MATPETLTHKPLLPDADNQPGGPSEWAEFDQATAVVAELRADPTAVDRHFHRIMSAERATLPGDDQRDLVIVPKADGWADS